jgi:hypothetical protein
MQATGPGEKDTLFVMFYIREEDILRHDITFNYSLFCLSKVSLATQDPLHSFRLSKCRTLGLVCS